MNFIGVLSTKNGQSEIFIKNPTTISRYDKRIKDSNEDLVIRVKTEDIKGAICRSHQQCVIARAIMRQRASTAKWVDVGNSVILVGTSKTTGVRYFLKPPAKEQVRFFDSNDGRFAPCTVTLNAPVHRKLGTRVNQPSGARKQRNKKRQVPTR